MPHIRYSTVTARYKQLKEKGLVIVDGTKRKGKSGRQQLVMWSKINYNGQ
jgi:DNA-binding transcriptional ArsR family regulator